MSNQLPCWLTPKAQAVAAAPKKPGMMRSHTNTTSYRCSDNPQEIIALALEDTMTSRQDQHQSTRDTHCPQCNSEEIEFDETYGFYKCNNCQHLWGHDKDDPDYDELLETDQLYDGLG